MSPESGHARADRLPADLGTRLLWAIAIAFTLLRFVALDADPSHLLMPDFFTDEGWYSLNARNHALFGKWVMDEHNVALVLCPLHTLALRASYALLGVSFWSTRIVGALASATTVLLIGWRLRSRPRTAALACALVATQPILFAMSRVAYCESLQLLFVTATWVCASDERRRARSWLLAGAAAGLAVFTKGSAVYAPLFALAAPFLGSSWDSRRRSLREAGCVALGFLVVAVGFAWFEKGFVDLFLAESGRESSVLSLRPRGVWLPLLIGLIDEGWSHPGFWFGILPLLTFVGVALSQRMLVGAQPDRAERVALAWFVLSLAALLVRRGPAFQERYWMNLLPPLACLAASAWGSQCEAARPAESIRTWSAALLLSIGPALLLRSAVQHLLPEMDPEAQAPLRFLGGATLLAALLLTLAFQRTRLAHSLCSRPAVLSVCAALVVGCSALASAAALRHPTYSMRETSRALATGGVPKVLMGDTANTFSLETPFRAFVHRDLAQARLGIGWINGDWRALGATHGLTDGAASRPPEPPAEGASLERTFEVWPDAEGRPQESLQLWSLPQAAAPR